MTSGPGAAVLGRRLPLDLEPTPHRPAPGSDQTSADTTGVDTGKES